MSGVTSIPGLTVGHWTDGEAATGCTVVLCPEGAVAGIDVRGTSPGTRETDLLHPVCRIRQVHAVVLAGGSAYGLAAADGVMRWLEERGHGHRIAGQVVPIVPAAVLFDLTVGRSDVRPTAEAGYAACESASSGPVAQGNVGAGAGAAAGKLLGAVQATKTGLGSAEASLPGGLVVAALVAVNPLGDVIDPDRGTVLAGARTDADSTKFADSWEIALLQQSLSPADLGANTTLAVVATNARLSKAEATKVAQMAQAGLTRAVRPAHTHFDGDTIFALSYGALQADVSLLGAMAAEVLAAAILEGVRSAEPAAGLPCSRQLLQAGGKENHR